MESTVICLQGKMGNLFFCLLQAGARVASIRCFLDGIIGLQMQTIGTDMKNITTDMKMLIAHVS